MDYYRIAPDVDAEDLLEPDPDPPAVTAPPPDLELDVGGRCNGGDGDDDSDDPAWFMSSKSAGKIRSKQKLDPNENGTTSSCNLKKGNELLQPDTKMPFICFL